ncbi:MAG: hypothetical protein AUJ75_00570 [Candidatus Omnitrophica bacterium CG1_02_49_10]|nr:MAG: hypothetical protein AUJ75_00570 [Candidatus Omnitrophica bacterium CG1_02_49_10]
MEGSLISVSRFHKMEGDGSLRAFADIEIAGAILIKGLRVVEGKKGVFVSMPRKPGKDGQWYETVSPLTDEFRKEIGEIVMAEYNKEVMAVA